jgi:hypothetical protein
VSVTGCAPCASQAHKQAGLLIGGGAPKAALMQNGLRDTDLRNPAATADSWL